MGGMGLDAAMIANTSGDLKKRVGWIAYVDGAARSLANAKPFRIAYQVHGRRLHSAKVQSILIANCGSLPAGLELIPQASVSDGELDIAIFQPKNALGWILVWRRVAWDNSVLRRFRAGRQVLALRTEDNSVLYARGIGARRRHVSRTARAAGRRRVRRRDPPALPHRRGRPHRDGAQGARHVADLTRGQVPRRRRVRRDDSSRRR